MYHMYMIDLDQITGFEWDQANKDKSFIKHKITANESEEIFLDENLVSFDDIKHSQKEPRYIALGKTRDNKILFVIFTIRSSQIRIISARLANKKEKKIYEKQT